jgi:hypothetical protein
MDQDYATFHECKAADRERCCTKPFQVDHEKLHKLEIQQSQELLEYSSF